MASHEKSPGSDVCDGQDVLSTEEVVETGDQVKGYLKATIAEGLKFGRNPEEDVVLRVFTDASFSPDGTETQHSMAVTFAAYTVRSIRRKFRRIPSLHRDNWHPARASWQPVEAMHAPWQGELSA